MGMHGSSSPPQLQPQPIYMSQQQLMMHHQHSVANAAASHHNNYLSHHQMWPTRSYDNGIGIYNHLSATTTTTTTKPTTTTDYFMDPLNAYTYNYNAPQSLQPIHTTSNSYEMSFPEHNTTTDLSSIPYLPTNKRTFCTAYQRQQPQHAQHAQHTPQQIFIPPNNYMEMLQQQTQQSIKPIQQTSNKLTRSSSHIGDNCNCYTCYALAPLFGAPLPVRPPRSLSQQQLRQHQLLSGSGLTEQWEHNIQPTTTNTTTITATPTRRTGLMKWCSESDVSVLDRNVFHTKHHHNYAHNDNDYDSDLEEHIYGRTNNICYNQKHTDSAASDYSNFGFGRALAFNSKAQTKQLHDYQLELVPSRTQPPPLPLLPTNDQHLRSSISPSLGLRKSLSSESFFEQPTEEGSLYMYGGRQRIQKTPSTTNIYDRVRNLLSNETTTDNSVKILHNNYKKLRNFFDQQDMVDEKLKAPKLPPPCWRMKYKKYQLLNENDKYLLKHTKQNLKLLNNEKNSKICLETNDTDNNKLDNNNNRPKNILNNINNNNNIKHYDIYKKTKEQYNINNNNNNNTTTATTAITTTTTTNTNTNTTATTATTITIDKKKSLEHQHNQQSKQIQQQQQQQYVKQQRNSRSSNCLDISDMESIYGYLKPRKPRSLSLKKIQILDY